MCSNDMALSLKGETFAALKSDFDSILGRTIGNMEMKGAEDATITLKLCISLEKTGMNGPNGLVDITKPRFKHEVNSVMQVKDKKTGALTGDYQIVWDDDEGTYVMRKIDDGQTNLFDKDDNTIEGEFRDVEQDALPEAVKGLPVHDAEFTEVVDSEDGTEDRAEPSTEKPITPFEWLKGFVGQGMAVHENGDAYTVRTEGGKIILSSEADISNPFYCSAEKLSQHVGCELTCVGYGPDEIVNVSIECGEHGVVLFDLDAPAEDELEAVVYDDPE